jgi:hypothetical protein
MAFFTVGCGPVFLECNGERGVVGWSFAMGLLPEMFVDEIEAAVKSFDLHVVCLDKTPEDCQASLESLLVKAMRAYETRGEGMRHGIALDKQVTIFLSEVDGEEKPMCGIYFNLHSPYKKAQPEAEPAESRN